MNSIVNYFLKEIQLHNQNLIESNLSYQAELRKYQQSFLNSENEIKNLSKENNYLVEIVKGYKILEKVLSFFILVMT